MQAVAAAISDGAVPDDAAIGRGANLAYALGGLGTGIVNSVPTILLLFFATEVLHIAAATAALIILLPKLGIIFWEPFVGNWSDRSDTRWGRRSPFMVVGAVLLTAAFLFLFMPPHLSSVATVCWVAVSYAFLMGSFSLYFVPYVAIPAELAIDEVARSSLVSWRMTFAMMGALASATMAPILVSIGGGGAGGYRLMALMIAPICLIAMVLPIRVRVRETLTATMTARPALGLLHQLKRAVGDRPFRILAVVQTMQVAAVGSMSAGMPYLIVNHMHRSSADVGLIFCAQLVPAVVAIPIFAALGRRIGHIEGQITAAAVFAAGTMLVGLLIYYQAAWLVIVATMPLIGLGFGGMQGQSYILSADLIHAANGANEAGASFTGVWTAAEKLGLALGPAATGVMLALLGAHLIYWQIGGPSLVALASIVGLVTIKQVSANIDRNSQLAHGTPARDRRIDQ